MSIEHHPDITTLMAFGAGTLPGPYATVVATHLAMSEGGRDTLRHINTIGGALLNAEPEAELADGALDRLMRALGEDERIDVIPHDERSTPDEVPQPLRPYLPNGLKGVRWKWTGPGVASANLAWDKDGRSRLMLLRVAAGRPVPEHGHGGQELTLILSGAFSNNLIDRALLGYVVDYVLFHTPVWSFAVFNLADAFITVGAGMVILEELLVWRREAKADGDGGSGGG